MSIKETVTDRQSMGLVWPRVSNNVSVVYDLAWSKVPVQRHLSGLTESQMNAKQSSKVSLSFPIPE